MSIKKILILGGSHRDIPLIKASQRLGYYVITLGNKAYYLGHQYADKYYQENFNDLDTVKAIMASEQIDYLLPGSGEQAYLNVVSLSAELSMGHFDTIDVAQLIHNKWAFKSFCLDHGISTPRGQYLDGVGTNKLDELAFPIVVKPTDLSGGRGVDIVHNAIELAAAVDQARVVSDEIFLEEYIEGQLIAYSIFVQNQRVIYSFVGVDDTYLNEYLITSAYPYSIDTPVLARLKADVERLASTLDIVDGMFHLQVIIKDQIPYIIDVTRRIPGDLYPDLIEYCDGVDYANAVVKAYTTGEIADEFSSPFTTQKHVVRHCVMPAKNGIYRGIELPDELKDNVISTCHLLKEGYEITDYLHTQLAIMFIDLTDVVGRDDFITQINDHIQAIVE